MLCKHVALYQLVCTVGPKATGVYQEWMSPTDTVAIVLFQCYI